MRNIRGIKAGVTISFAYNKDGVSPRAIEHRTGIVEKVFRTQGKSAIKANRRKLIVFNVIEPGANHPKSFHFSKMHCIKVGI